MSNSKPYGQKLGRDTADLELPEMTERHQPASELSTRTCPFVLRAQADPRVARGTGATRPGNAHICVAASSKILTPDT